MLNISISPYKQDKLDWEIQINKKLRQSVAILSIINLHGRSQRHLGAGLSRINH